MSELILAVAQSIATPGDLARSIANHVRLASRAADQHAKIVVFPELSLTGYDRGLTRADALVTSDHRLQPLQVLADASEMIVIAGAPIASPSGLHIGGMSFIPGRGVQVYQKQYLHEGEEVVFAPGEGGDSLRIDDDLACVAICADINHAGHAVEAAGRGATIYAASCFITPDSYGIDAGLLEGYAREHRMVVLMANYGAGTGGWLSAGRSAIWSNTGTLLACGPAEGEAIIVTRQI